MISIATPTFSTTPDLPLSLPASADIDRQSPMSADVGNSKWRRYIPEVEITFERKAMAISTASLTFSTMPGLDMALPTMPDIGRLPELNVGYETGSGNILNGK